MTSEIKQRKVEDGWFRVSSAAGCQIRIWWILIAGIAAWLCAMIFGFFWSAIWWTSISPDPGIGQDITLFFIFPSNGFVGLILLVFGSIVARQGLKSGEIGYVWFLSVLVVSYSILPSMIYGEIFESPPVGLFWGLHCGTNYGVVSALVFWLILIVHNPELVPDAGKRTSALQFIVAVGVFALGQLATGIGIALLL